MPMLAGTVDFESFSDSQQVTSQIAGLQFVNATAINITGLLNDGEFPPHSGISAAFDDGGPMVIRFAVPELSVSGYFTYSARLVVNAYDAANALVASATSAFGNNMLASGAPGSSPNEFLSVAAPAIVRVTLTGDPGGGSFTLDDLSYTEAGVTSVPEPGTGLLFSVSFAAAWAIRRLRG